MIERLKSAFLRRRPFPVTPAALAHCRVSYSQFGEDLFLASLFPPTLDRGYYVDVGCYRPVQFSNTYRLYQLGWHGLAIDASVRWQKEWSAIRPRDHFVLAPIAAERKRMFLCFDNLYPTCSRLVDPETEYGALELTDPRFSASEVLARPLNDVLKAHGAPADFHLLNIDCEGLDLQVLRSMDFAEFRPRVIAIEDHDVTGDSETSLALRSKGYHLSAMIGYTKIFSAP